MNYFHSLLTKITGNRFARLQRRDTWTNGLRTFGELDVINRPLAKYNASEDKKKKEKSRKKDRVRQNYGFIYRGGIIVSIIFSSWNAYTMTNCLWAIFCFFFSSFYFSSYRRWCSSFLLGLLYMFFFSIGAGDMIQVHHPLHRFFFLYFSLVMFRFSCGYITLFHHVGRRDLRKAGRLGVLWVCGGDGWDKVLVWIIPFHCLFLLVSTHLYAILWIHGWIGRITFCMYILRCTIMVSIAFCSTSLKYLRFFGE